MNTHLPQICCSCHKLKISTLGRFIRPKHAFNRVRFICAACDEKEVSTPRLARKDKETFPERLVRKTLEELRVEAVAEFTVGPFTFDFAIPRLRLLVEVNSKRWHSGFRRKRRDMAKAKTAEKHHWELVSLPVNPHLQFGVVQAVTQRKSLLGFA